MSNKTSYFLSITSVNFVISFILFLYGFFPLDTQYEGHSTLRDVSLPVDLCLTPRNLAADTTYKPLYKHTIIIVIDGLRDTFLNNNTFPFVSDLIKRKHAISYTTRVFSPTVTLPRIKTIVTGSVPGFADVVLNLDANILRHDNILYQAHTHLRKIRFYGDDTWLKLFPSNYFAHSEGTTSFIVSDYLLVDRNVTINMAKTAHDAANWDMLILHYLGLDHIGHYLGPDSSEITPKLREMDNVVKYLFENLPKDSLLIVTGDHGMSITGGHGGGSEVEMNVPLVFATNAHTWMALPHAPYPVHQTDIAPTLSLLLGLPIPKCSYGHVISDVLKAHPNLHQEATRRLFRLQYNLQQVHNVYLKHFDHPDVDQTVRSTLCYYLDHVHKGTLLQHVDEIEQHMHSVIFMLKQNLLLSKTKMSLFHIFIGTACAFASAFAACAVALGAVPTPHDKILLILAGILSLGTNILLSVLLIGETIITFVILTGFSTWALYWFLLIWAGVRKSHFNAPPSFIGVFQVAAMILYVVSLFGSSFVEEEHQTWFFLPVSICIVAAITSPLMRIKMDPITDVIRLMLISRLLRIWNRQGDKQSQVPAICDWLRDDHEYVLTGLLLANAYNVLRMFINRNSRRQAAIMCTAFITVLSYKLYIVHYGKHDDMISGLLYLWIPVIIVSGLFETCAVGCESKEQHLHPLSTLSNVWILLSFILHRPENMYMFGMIIFLENAVHCCTQNYTVWIRAVFYFWFANASFFYQGNANKISTVDVAAGYTTGFGDYCTPLVGFLIACHTYSGFVHWIIMFWRRTALTLSERDKIRLLASILGIKLILASWFLIVMIAHRHHLFVWTVFSPKLLYEGAASLVLMATLWLVSVLNK